MSAIGDYIHFTAKGYKEHGITKDGRFSKWKSQRAVIINRAASHMSKMSPKDREELAAVLNDMARPAEDKTLLAEAQRHIQKELSEKYKASLGKINWDTTNVEWTKKKSEVIGTISRHKNEQGQLEINLNEMLKKVDKLQKIISKEVGKARLNNKLDLESKLKAESNELLKLIEQIKDHMNKNLKKDGWAYSVTNSKKLTTDSQVLKHLNSLIDAYAAYPAIGAQKGFMFEAMIAMAPYVAQGMSMEEAMKQIKGSQVEKIEFDTSGFSKDYVSFKGDSYSLETTGSVSQGKIDIELKWNNKIARVSAKNVNLENPDTFIHILDGSSLLFLIQDMNRDYVNHFLNLQSEHWVAKEKDGFRKLEKNPFANQRKLILKEMKLYLFYKALTGDNYKRKSANIFIINDNSKGEVYVYSIVDIINKVIYNDKLLSQISIQAEGNAHRGGNIMDLPLFKNDRVPGDGTGKQRITKILAQVHATKISARFKPSVLTHIW